MSQPEQRRKLQFNPNDLEVVTRDGLREAFARPRILARNHEFRVCARRYTSDGIADRITVHTTDCRKAPADQAVSGRRRWYVRTVESGQVAAVLEELGARPGVEALACPQCGGWRDLR